MVLQYSLRGSQFLKKNFNNKKQGKSHHVLVKQLRWSLLIRLIVGRCPYGSFSIGLIVRLSAILASGGLLVFDSLMEMLGSGRSSRCPVAVGCNGTNRPTILNISNRLFDNKNVWLSSSQSIKTISPYTSVASAMAFPTPTPRPPHCSAPLPRARPAVLYAAPGTAPAPQACPATLAAAPAPVPHA
jgi:hypothetical protein